MGKNSQSIPPARARLARPKNRSPPQLPPRSPGLGAPFPNSPRKTFKPGPPEKTYLSETNRKVIPQRQAPSRSIGQDAEQLFRQILGPSFKIRIPAPNAQRIHRLPAKEPARLLASPQLQSRLVHCQQKKNGKQIQLSLAIDAQIAPLKKINRNVNVGKAQWPNNWYYVAPPGRIIAGQKIPPPPKAPRGWLVGRKNLGSERLAAPFAISGRNSEFRTGLSGEFFILYSNKTGRPPVAKQREVFPAVRTPPDLTAKGRQERKQLGPSNMKPWGGAFWKGPPGSRPGNLPPLLVKLILKARPPGGRLVGTSGPKMYGPLGRAVSS